MRILIFLTIYALLGFDQNGFDWLSFKMVKRTTMNGQMTRVESDVYYKKNGEMITHFDQPIEMYVFNNELGDVRLYNPVNNTVVKTLDNRFGSQNTTFYYFLIGHSDDLGLKSAGFEQIDSRIEDMMLISNWDAPSEVKNQLDQVELVSNGEAPVFMGYLDKKGNYVKKIFYYGFKEVGQGMSRFPMSITEIDYIKGDSVITKTTFGSFEFDNQSDLSILNFEIPKNAKLVE